ncbi:MAG: tRNA lysidine(34) synthetase TilS [Deltaproteobacteria bacterium]|nr:tRNA lysidine(34) synthetase TilS [Deltaproteobacteria bacterium]
MGQSLAALPAEVARAVRALGLLGRPVLVAVSGGVDSIVLLHALAELREELGLDLSVGHVHHGLRGEEADADAGLVEASARALGCRFALEHVEPAALREVGPSRDRPTLQEAARQLRREALRSIAAELGADRVATAHQRDDQAETLLLRLFRGTGPEGLGGIPEQSPDGLFVRPLLNVPRTEILAWARDQGLRWREDASNTDPRFARASLRDELRQLAERLRPGWDRALADLAEAQRRENEWIEALIAEEARDWWTPEGDGLRLRAEGWDDLPPALARRLLRKAWHQLGGGRDVTRQHLDRAHRFLARGAPGSRLEWPGGLVLTRGPLGARLGPGERVGDEGRPTSR